MEILAENLGAEDAYKLLVGSVVPRPIAWVTTLSKHGHVNAAPFSAFTFVCYMPPMVAISIGRKGDRIKDTSLNIARTREFVVNIADDSLIRSVHLSSTEYPAHVSEVEELGLEVKPGRRVGVPHLAAAPISMECSLERVLEFGGARTELIVGEVKLFRIRDGLCEGGKIDTAKLRPLARLGGPKYMALGEILTMPPVHVTAKS